MHLGGSLVIQAATGALAIAATPKKGATVLGRELERLQVCAGDHISVTFRGMRATADGERRYRWFEVAVLSRASRWAA